MLVSKNVGHKKFVPNKISVQTKNVGPKNNLFQNIVGSKKCIQNKMLVPKFLGPKFIWDQQNFVLTKFCSDKIWALQNCGPNKMLVQRKIFHENYGQNYILVTK